MFQRILKLAPLRATLQPQRLFTTDASSAPTLPTLNHYLSKSGVASRRNAGAMVQEGRVKVNGVTVVDPAYRVQPTDVVHLSGDLVNNQQKVEPIVLLLNKPEGYECSRPTRNTERTVYDLFNERDHIFHCVGRLDKNSEGLLLLTNDGDTLNNIIHPSKNLEKEYLIQTHYPLLPDQIDQMCRGFEDEGEMVKALRVEAIENNREFNYSVVLNTGRKREVRRLVKAFKNGIAKLRRVRIGGLLLGNAPMGKVIQLTTADVERIYQNPSSSSKSSSSSSSSSRSNRSGTAERSIPKKPMQSHDTQSNRTHLQPNNQSSKPTNHAQPQGATSRTPIVSSYRGTVGNIRRPLGHQNQSPNS